MLDTAGRCDAIAKTILTMRHELAQVNLPAADKQHLLAGLQSQAAAWSSRGAVWRAPSSPSTDSDVKGISKHQKDAFAAFSHVQHYLKPSSDFHLT